MSLDRILELLTERLDAWGEALVANLPNLVAAALVAALFGFLSRPVGALVARSVRRLDASSAIETLATSLARLAVVVVGVTIGLGLLGLDKTIFSMLAGAGVLGIAIGFAFQDLAANLIAGVAMGLRKPFGVGDLVRTNGAFGTVQKLNLRNTLVLTPAGQVVVVPNKEVFEHPLENYSLSGRRRVDVEVGVAYGTDLQEVVRVSRDAIEELDFLLEDADVEVLARGFGSSSIDLSVRYWIDPDGAVSWPRALHAGVLAVQRAFEEHGIEIPFPIRTVELRREEAEPEPAG